jgi:hypothetical protein
MTAAEYQALATDAAQAIVRVEAVTEQVRLRGLAFDYDAPLPPMPDYRARSWEPAARHYRDLDDDERTDHTTGTL